MTVRYLKPVIHPTKGQITYNSSTNKRMLVAKDSAEDQMVVVIRGGSSSLWFDNWNGSGALISEGEQPLHYLSLKQVWNGNSWDFSIIQEAYPTNSLSMLDGKSVWLAKEADHMAWKREFRYVTGGGAIGNANGREGSVSFCILLRLEGKVALITGAASGIGEETVRLFVENGAFVVAADVQDELGHQLVASFGSDKVSYHHCDVRDEMQVEDTIGYTLAKYGSLDILFSNAGIIGPLTSILDLDIQGFDNTMATNVRGVAATIKHAARAMVARKVKGSIICTTSVAACLGGAGPHAYTTSKHALIGLVRTACSELGAYGIRVNSISPFGVATPLPCTAYNLQPRQVEENCCASANLKGIVLKTKHIAEAALFLASDESAYISGHNLVVDGGFTVVSNSLSAI
ncbi:hypothetical protein ACH5RR_040868 [Cinchona calisaya]|uniref:Uncharacterized protein n=1 Tax=Cinchona calisaya TaxID=153742 RepID=A0ABD2XTX1_9GENT